ncbi:MAG TPA: hypothetical protein DCQ51_13930 [Planktothrix sp. UBA8407]|jgi:hypothetical protein|nr:hypothetical protein [Planktothrix sp. UBA8402]HAO12234.1 hypothetical protein [Planktothrix sp. UBA8407]HBK21356.1 hypothetical protein [Planktothrix sp. UBA10369]
MESENLISVCRHCQKYTPEGHRGGHCQLLQVSVKGSWKSCQLSLPAFSPAWETLENLINLQPETPRTAAGDVLLKSHQIQELEQTESLLA